MTLYTKLFYAVAASFLLSASNLSAAEPSARSILDKSYRYIAGMDKYAFDATVVAHIPEGDKLATYKNTVSIKVDRPDKLRADIKGKKKDRTIYVNHGLFTIYDHDFNYYGQLKTPKTINGALDFIFNKYGIRAPMAALVYSDMDKRGELKNGNYFGIVDVNGVKCHYVAFKHKDEEVHVWIDAGDKPLIRTYTLIDVAIPSHPRTDTTVKWIDSPTVSDSDFVFKAPKGATKISIEPAN